MNEERLQEIKDSIDFQYTLAKAKGYYNALLFTNEEEELIEEIERLNSIIKEVREYIENNWISKKDADIHRFDNEELEIEIGDIAVILEILDKVNNNEDN